MPKPNHYATLGVAPTATDKEIKQAYRRKALEFHPDKNPNGEALFKQVVDAYQVLMDPARRAEFDEQLQHAGVPHKPRGGHHAGSSRNGHRFATETLNVSEIIRRDREMQKRKEELKKAFGFNPKESVNLGEILRNHNKDILRGNGAGKPQRERDPEREREREGERARERDRLARERERRERELRELREREAEAQAERAREEEARQRRLQEEQRRLQEEQARRDDERRAKERWLSEMARQRETEIAKEAELRIQLERRKQGLCRPTLDTTPDVSAISLSNTSARLPDISGMSAAPTLNAEERLRRLRERQELERQRANQEKKEKPLSPLRNEWKAPFFEGKPRKQPERNTREVQDELDRRIAQIHLRQQQQSAWEAELQQRRQREEQEVERERLRQLELLQHLEKKTPILAKPVVLSHTVKDFLDFIHDQRVQAKTGSNCRAESEKLDRKMAELSHLSEIRNSFVGSEEECCQGV